MFSAIGYGSFILDIYYHDGKYAGCDGGGSVFNVIANLADQGLEATAMGYGGADSAANLCIDSLTQHGVHADAAHLRKGISTRRLHLDIRKQASEIETQENVVVTKKCFACHQVAWPNCEVPALLSDSFKKAKRGFVLFDLYVNPQKALIADHANEAGFCACIDIGHTGPLVYYTSSQISKLFRSMKIIQFNQRVSAVLFSKFKVSNFMGVFEHLACKLMIVTQGSAGADFYFRDIYGNIQSLHYTPEAVSQVVDVSGAGDAFLSGVLKAYCDNYDEEVFPKSFFEKAFASGNAMARKTLTSFGARGHLANHRLRMIDFSKESPEKCSFCGL